MVMHVVGRKQRRGRRVCRAELCYFQERVREKNASSEKRRENGDRGKERTTRIRAEIMKV